MVAGGWDRKLRTLSRWTPTNVYPLLVEHRQQTKVLFPQSTTWELMSLLGLCTDHEWGTTYRIMGDPNAGMAPGSSGVANTVPVATEVEAPCQSPFHSLYSPAPETMRPWTIWVKLHTICLESIEGADETQMRTPKLPTQNSWQGPSWGNHESGVTAVQMKLGGSSAWYIVFTKTLLVTHINHEILRTLTALFLTMTAIRCFIKWECLTIEACSLQAEDLLLGIPTVPCLVPAALTVLAQSNLGWAVESLTGL